MGEEEPLSDQEILKEIVSLYSEAERAIKYIEDFGQTLVFPAVNQLRYTGNHLVRYLSNHDKEELSDALKHVKRSTYDSYETAIVYQMGLYSKFKADYQKVEVTKVIPDYLDIKEKIETARNFIRDHNGSKTRGENYRDGKEHLDQIVCLMHRLEIAREELNKLIRKERFIFICQIAGLIGVVAAVFGAVVGVIVWSLG